MTRDELNSLRIMLRQITVTTRFKKQHLHDHINLEFMGIEQELSVLETLLNEMEEGLSDG